MNVCNNTGIKGHSKKSNVLLYCLGVHLSGFLVMVALCIAQTIIFLPCSFFLSSSFFISSPNLSGRRLDVYYTLTHGVVLVRI